MSLSESQLQIVLELLEGIVRKFYASTRYFQNKRWEDCIRSYIAGGLYSMIGAAPGMKEIFETFLIEKRFSQKRNEKKYDISFVLYKYS